MFKRKHTIWTVVETVAALVALGLFLTYMGLWEQYAHTKPDAANLSSGRIYPLNEHGLIVYLTSAEQNRLHMLAWMAGFCFLIAVLIGIFIKKSWGRRNLFS